ncbi:MAG TPA: hypothetical protein PKL31_13925 [Fulvivirga sp.]|nr:hypothetical protein [Fulvivirga sp.]
MNFLQSERNLIFAWLVGAISGLEQYYFRPSRNARSMRLFTIFSEYRNQLLIKAGKK